MVKLLGLTQWDQDENVCSNRMAGWNENSGGMGIEKSILDPLFDEVPHAFCMLVYILSVLLHSKNLTLINFDVYKSFL